MAALNKAIDKQSLKGLSPLGKLTPDKIDEIISKSRVENLPAGRVVFRQGDSNNHKIYLLSGQIELSSAGKNRKKTIKSKSVEAKFPIADDIPRKSTAKTKTASSLLYIDASLLEILLDDNPSGEYEVTEINVAEHSSDWMMRFLQSRAFLKLPTENIQKVLMKMEEVQVAAGEAIIRQNDEGDYYYIIKNGQCSVTRRPTEKQDEIRLALLAEGDGFGEESLITRGKRNANVKMLEDGTLMRLKKDDFLELLVSPLLRNVHLNSLKNSLYQSWPILDIRNGEAFKSGSLEKAKHIPLSMLRLRMPTLDTSKHYLIYSDNKDDAGAALFLMAQHGIESHVLLGDIKDSNKTSIIKKEPVREKAEPATVTTSDKPARHSPQIKSRAEKENSTQNKTSASINASEPTNQPDPDFQHQLDKLKQYQNEARAQAEKMLAEAEAIRQSAVEEASRLKDRLKQEETSRLRTELEQTRSKADAAIQKSEQLADQIRKQAEQEGSQIRQQAITEAEKLRAEIEQLRQQETQMKLQLESEMLAIKQQTSAQAQEEAEQEASRARQAAEEAALVVKQMAEQEAEKTRTRAQKEAEQARQIALQEAEATLALAEKAAAEAQANAEKLTNEAKNLEHDAEQARRKAEQEARAIRQAALEEAELIKQSALEESHKIKQASSAKSPSIISHDNIFELDDEATTTTTITSQPIAPYVDEASTALEMAKEIREKLLEAEAQRLENEKLNAARQNKEQVTVKKIKNKTILETEKEIFVFKEPTRKKSYARTFNDHVSTGVFNINGTTENPAQSNLTESQIIFPSGDRQASNFTPAPVIPLYEQELEQDTKRKRSLLAVAASIFLVTALSLIAYTTQIQINFTEVDALVNQEGIELEEEKIKKQAEEDFKNRLKNIHK